ncbi:MAG: hypothetical protein PVI78_12845, partial [Anaerolineales bacterium]
ILPCAVVIDQCVVRYAVNPGSDIPYALALILSSKSFPRLEKSRFCNILSFFAVTDSQIDISIKLTNVSLVKCSEGFPVTLGYLVEQL